MPEFGMQGVVAGGTSTRGNEVNTSGLAVFSADSTMLRIGFAGDSMFLTIIPRVQDPNGGRPRWPRELGHTASFKAHLARALYDGFMKKILPDIEAGKDHIGHVVVPLNREGTNLAGFSYVGGRAVFTIFMNTAADKVCSEQYSFMFEQTAMIDEYNPNTGSYTVFPAEGQLFVVVEALRSFSEAMTAAAGHGNKRASAWITDMTASYVRGIAQKLNVNAMQFGSFRGSGPDSGYGGYGGGYGGGFGGGQFGGATAPGYAAPPANIQQFVSDNFTGAGENSPFDLPANAEVAALTRPSTPTIGSVQLQDVKVNESQVGHGSTTPVQPLTSLDELMAS